MRHRHRSYSMCIQLSMLSGEGLCCGRLELHCRKARLANSSSSPSGHSDHACFTAGRPVDMAYTPTDRPTVCVLIGGTWRRSASAPPPPPPRHPRPRARRCCPCRCSRATSPPLHPHARPPARRPTDRPSGGVYVCHARRPVSPFVRSLIVHAAAANVRRCASTSSVCARRSVGIDRAVSVAFRSPGTVL